MTFADLGMYALKIRLAFLRYGLSKTIAVASCIVGLSIWIVFIPALQHQQKLQEQNWLSAQQAAKTINPDKSIDIRSMAEQNYNQFMDILGSPLDTEKQVKTLFALARNTGLTLSKAEYKFSEDKNGRYRTYQILMPVKGPYSSIRQFCEKALLAIPFASLDEMSFKRENIATGNLEARLRFTLFLLESNPEALNKKEKHFNSNKGAL